jgi:4-amino-4-deoxy-L-arabinose transferase-like glycosyltransferase
MITSKERQLEGTRAASTSNLSRLWGQIVQARGFIGGLAAFGLAAFAQQNLVHNMDEERATTLYAIAILLLLVSLFRFTRRVKRDETKRTDNGAVSLAGDALAVASADPPILVRPIRGGSGRSSRNPLRNFVVRFADYWTALHTRLGRRATVIGMGLTLSLAGAALAVLWLDNGSPFGGWLWAFSMLAMLLTFLGAGGPPEKDSLLLSPRSDFYWLGQPRISARVETLLMVVLLAVSLALRVWNLETHPGYYGDEGERGLEGRSIYAGRSVNMFGYGWWSVPNLYFYVISWFMRVFGDGIVGDRMVSVASGMVMIWFVYRTARLLWGPRAGLLAGAMMAVSPLALQFSRSASESSVTGALWSVGFYFFFMALRYRRWSDWALSGLAWGLSMYFYASSKLIIPLLGVIGVYCLLRWRKRFVQRYALGFGLTLLAFVIAFMPNALVTLNGGWPSFTQRAAEMSVFSPQNQPIDFANIGIVSNPDWQQEPLTQNIIERPGMWGQIVFRQLRVALEVIYKIRDGAGYYVHADHGGSMMQPLWAALTLLGLAYATAKLADARFGLALLWFWGGMMGVAMTIDTPTVQRITGAWPAVMLFPAALLDRVFAAGWPLSYSLARRWATVPLVGLLIYFGVDSYNEYFVHYAASYPKFWNTYAAYAKGLGQEYKAYQLPHDYGARFDYGVVRFIAKDVEGRNVYSPLDFLPVTDNNHKGLAFVVPPESATYLTVLRQFYPGGVEEPILDVAGSPQFSSYKVSREQMAQLQTSHASYRFGAQEITRSEPGIGTRVSPGNPSPWTPPTGLIYPVEATWSGSFVVASFGTYNLELQGPENAMLSLDGKPVLDKNSARTPGAADRADISIVLARGMHDFSLSGTLQNPTTQLTMLLSASGIVPETISPAYLSNRVAGGLSSESASGIAVEGVTGEDPLGTAQVFERDSYPIIGFREQEQALTPAPPAVIRWRGKIRIGVEGTYVFALESNGPGVIRIDGQEVANSMNANTLLRSAQGQVELKVGEHDVDLRYGWPGGPTRAEWLWMPPGGQHMLVPPSVLVPGERWWPSNQMPGVRAP